MSLTNLVSLTIVTPPDWSPAGKLGPLTLNWGCVPSAEAVVYKKSWPPSLTDSFEKKPWTKSIIPLNNPSL